MLNIFVVDEIQNLLYIQARLQCNFGDDQKRNEDILKTGRGLTIKLSKNVLCFMYFFLYLRYKRKNRGSYSLRGYKMHDLSLFSCKHSKCFDSKLSKVATVSDRMHTDSTPCRDNGRILK